MPVTGDALIGWLERDFDYRPAGEVETADAIVVAGGAFSSGLGQWPYPDAGGNVDRYWHAARLYHAERAPLVILSGGRDPRRPESWSEAESGAIFLRDLGVPDAALVLESRARTTRDNATLVAEILERAASMTSCWSPRPPTCAAPWPPSAPPASTRCRSQRISRRSTAAPSTHAATCPAPAGWGAAPGRYTKSLGAGITECGAGCD